MQDTVLPIRTARHRQDLCRGARDPRAGRGGRRVAVASNSHEAIRTSRGLPRRAARRRDRADRRACGARPQDRRRRRSAMTTAAGDRAGRQNDAAALRDADVVGGTAFLFAGRSSRAPSTRWWWTRRGRSGSPTCSPWGGARATSCWSAIRGSCRRWCRARTPATPASPASSGCSASTPPCRPTAASCCRVTRRMHPDALPLRLRAGLRGPAREPPRHRPPARRRHALARGGRASRRGGARRQRPGARAEVAAIRAAIAELTRGTWTDRGRHHPAAARERHHRRRALQRAGQRAARGAARAGARRHRRQVPGPGGAGLPRVDDRLLDRGRAARHGLPVLAQPHQRRGLPRQGARPRLRLAAAARRALRHRRGGPPRQHPLRAAAGGRAAAIGAPHDPLPAHRRPAPRQALRPLPRGPARPPARGAARQHRPPRRGGPRPRRRRHPRRRRQPSTPRRRRPTTLRHALHAMAADPGARWWLLPGNHDSLAASELWAARSPPTARRTSAAALTPSRSRSRPAPCLLPAPCTHRRPGRDLTDWMAGAATPAGALRIGLAHGAVQAFSEDGNPALIPPDRAETAGLALLALGDWHGQLADRPAHLVRRHAPRPTASSTPARRRAPGYARRPGAAPEVTPVGDRRASPGGARALELLPGEDPAARLAALLPPVAARRDTLLRVAARGRTGLAGEAALDRAARRGRARLRLARDRPRAASPSTTRPPTSTRSTPRAARCGPPPRRCAREADDPALPGAEARGRARRALPPLRLRRRSRMKLRSISLTNVRRFAGTTAPPRRARRRPQRRRRPERGRQVDLLRGARRRCSSCPPAPPRAEARALRPYAGGAPEVAAEVELDGRRYRIAKRWLSRPFARVTELPSGRVVAQDDEAEAWIRDRLAGADGGPAGLLWVRQGMLALEPEGRTPAEKAEQDRLLVVRRDLLSSVAGEVDGDHRRPAHGRDRRPLRGRSREDRHRDRQAEDRRPLEGRRSTRPARCATSSPGSTRQCRELAGRSPSGRGARARWPRAADPAAAQRARRGPGRGRARRRSGARCTGPAAPPAAPSAPPRRAGGRGGGARRPRPDHRPRAGAGGGGRRRRATAAAEDAREPPPRREADEAAAAAAAAAHALRHAAARRALEAARPGRARAAAAARAAALGARLARAATLAAEVEAAAAEAAAGAGSTQTSRRAARPPPPSTAPAPGWRPAPSPSPSPICRASPTAITVDGRPLEPGVPVACPGRRRSTCPGSAA